MNTLNTHYQVEEVPLLDITEPKPFLRFRGSTDLSSHGVLEANDADKKNPGVKLWIPPKYANTEITITCQLYQKPTVNDAGPFRLSPHKLNKLKNSIIEIDHDFDDNTTSDTDVPSSSKSNKRRKMSPKKQKPTKKLKLKKTPNRSSPIASFICEKMTRNPNNSCELSFELKDYFIQNPVKKQWSNELLRKYEYFQNWKNGRHETLSDEERAKIADEVKKPQDTVCLGFEVFIKEDSGFKSILGPKLSNPILNASPLRIVKFHSNEGSVDGGNIVLALLSKLPKEFKVCVYQIEDSGKKIWQREIEILEVFKQNHAIMFKMPKYDGINLYKIKCIVEVTRTIENTPNSIASVDYTYKQEIQFQSLQEQQQMSPDIMTEVPIKLIADSMAEVKIDQQEEKKSPLTKKELTIDLALAAIRKIVKENSKTENEIIEAVKSINERYAKLQETGNSIFHDVLASGNFLYLYKMSQPFRELLKEAINKHQENLLHYACKLNKPTFIRSLIGFGCSIVAQDISGNTPLHNAILEQNDKCIKKFQELIKDASGYPQAIPELKRLLNIYNQEGHNILYLAAMHDFKELVQDMLEFSNVGEIDDACTIELLADTKKICQ